MAPAVPGIGHNLLDYLRFPPLSQTRAPLSSLLPRLYVGGIITAERRGLRVKFEAKRVILIAPILVHHRAETRIDGSVSVPVVEHV